MPAEALGPRVLVVGTGAMASLFAARLQRFGGARVCLAGTWREALDLIAARGIEVEDDSRLWAARPEARLVGSPLEPADLVLVLVKGHQTTSVAPAVARALKPSGHVLTLQNGLGNREVLEAAVGEGRVSVGVATVGTRLQGPGRVRATAESVALGLSDAPALGLSPAPAPGLYDFARLLTASGFETSLEPNVDRMIWRKLVINCAINPLSALEGCTNGGLLEDAETRATLVQAAREAGAVAAARGIDLGADPAELVVAVAERTAANRSSMLQDVERGARTEIDSLNGALVREARRLGVPVPVNDALWSRILALEPRAVPSATA